VCAAGPDPQAFAVGLLDGDLRPDLAVANSAGLEVDVLIGNGDGTFKPATPFPVGTTGNLLSVAIGDLNGDKKMDLVTGASFTTNTIGVLLGNGDGTFQAAQLLGSGGSGWTAALGDANGDGKLDILATNDS